jgi:cell division protein FtsQ
MFWKSGEKNEVCTRLAVNVAPIGEQNYVSAEQIVNLLNIKGFGIKDKKTSEIRIDQIRETIENNLAVKKAKCYFAKNGDLKIDIVQRTPFFRVTGNSTYYVDTDSVIFKTAPDFNADVLIVQGNFSEKFAKNELFEFVKLVNNDEFLKNLIKKISVENNSVKITPRIGNQTIIVGKITDTKENEIKLERLKKFYSNGVLNKMGWEKYTEIDLRFKKQVVCR